MGEITYLNKAASKGESLRTTVPMSIVKQFGLTEDDKLDWISKSRRQRTHYPHQTNQKQVIFRKMES